MALQASNVKMTDWGVMGCAAGLLLFSFVGSFVTVSFDNAEELSALTGVDPSGGVSSAWSSYGGLGVVLLLAVGAVAAALVFGDVSLPTIPVGWNLVLAGAAALGTLLLVLRAFTYAEGGEILGGSVSFGPGWSGWLVMLLAVAETVFAVLAFRASGEQVPWRQPSSRPPT